MLYSSVHSGRRGRPVQRAGSPFESLEDRTLFATVPAGFAYADYVTGLPECTSMTFAPDGRIFYTEKSGAVRVIKDGVKLSTPAVRVSVDGYFERGLESIVLDPQFSTNGIFYLYYTKRPATNPNTAPNDAKNRVSRFQLNTSGNTDVVNPNVPEAVVLDNIPSDSGYHNGGAMVFDNNPAVPANQRLLYIGTGEVGLPQFDQATDRAQDLSSLAGKILRINPRAGAQKIPSDNPFVGQSGKRAEIYSYGLRNPFTMAVKPGSNLIYANDVGSYMAEEVNQVKKGANYGFPRNEGYTSQAGYENPVHAYTHASTGHPNGQAAITGGAFYTADRFPSQYQGKYFFSDYINKFIAFFDPANPPARGATAAKFATGTNAIIDLDVGPDGNLYGLTHTVGSTTAKIVKISYAGSANRNPEAVASADKTSGALPLTVNFSGDGTTDPDGDTLTYNWAFGDGATATGKTVSHTYTVKGVYSAKLTVTDGKGGSDVSDTIVVDAGNQAPNVSITLPADGSLYSGGETINFTGTATDPEDGALPASRFDWKVSLFHDTHTHPFLDDSIDGVTSGSFTVPVDVETAPNQFYRIELTVADNTGLATTTHVNIQPRTATFTLDSNIAGITLNLDGQPRATPASILGVVGTRRRIEAPESQAVDGVTYEFVEWSDGGERFHDISSPPAATTYTATYRVSAIQQAEVRAAADAYVRDGTSSATNFGTAGDLIVKKANLSGNTRESYLRFDIGDFDNVAGATLRVFGRSGSSTQNVGVAIYGSSNVTWSETSLTWNNRPGTGASPVAPGVTVGGTTGQWYEFDVGDHVAQQRAAGATAVTFVLRSPAATAAQAIFNSDENAANKPLLIVRHKAAEPAQGLIISKATLPVPEGGAGTFTVRLAVQPAADVVVTVARQSGDADLSAAPGTLTFTPDNWDAPQTVTVTAAADDDTSNGSAVFAVSSPDLATKTLTATEQDDDAPAGPVTLRANADATVRGGSYAGNNYGAAVDLTVKKQSDLSFNREAYLRFDLSGVAGVGSAKLRLFGKLTEAATVQTGVYAAPDAAWTETGITWNNRPATGTSALATATLTSTSGVWLEWDLTAYFKAEKAAGRNEVTIALKNLAATNAAALYASDEAASNRPELVVEPATSEPGGLVTRTTTVATHVRDGSANANTNYGTAIELELKKASVGYNREAWLKFDLSGLSTLTSGKLRLFGLINSSESVGVGVFSSAVTAWNESTLTFNNRPAAGTTAIATATVSGNTAKWHEWDLTGFLEAERAAGRTTVTLVLRPLAGTSATIDFNSDEAASNRPELLIDQ